MKEVVCTIPFNDATHREMLVNRILPPEINDIFHVLAESFHDGKRWYAFKERPDIYEGPSEVYRHWFEQSYFTEITGLQGQINHALTREKPKEVYFTALDEWTYTGTITRSYIAELDFKSNPDLTMTETCVMIKNARFALANTRDPFKQKWALVQLDALMKHLARLSDKFRKG